MIRQKIPHQSQDGAPTDTGPTRLRRQSRRLASAVVVALATSNLAWPQRVSAQQAAAWTDTTHARAVAAPALEGSVKDAEGLPVAGAIVVLRNEATGFERVERTTATGAFTFRAVPETQPVDGGR